MVFWKSHICIPKIQYLHTKTWKSAYHVNFQTYFDFECRRHLTPNRENAVSVKVKRDNFRILSEIFHQNMFEYSLLQHTYRLKWTALQNRHTFHKQLVNWHLQGDTWFSWLGNNCLNWTWDGRGLIMIRGAFKIKKWEKLVFWTTQGEGGLTESQLFGKISQN